MGEIKRSVVTCEEADMLDHLLGKAVIIRTVTSNWTGRLDAFDEQMLMLSDAAWIANTGRYSDSLTAGELDEVEPAPEPVLIGRGAIVDMTTWAHDLPRVQK